MDKTYTISIKGTEELPAEHLLQICAVKTGYTGTDSEGNPISVDEHMCNLIKSQLMNTVSMVTNQLQIEKGTDNYNAIEMKNTIDGMISISSNK